MLPLVKDRGRVHVHMCLCVVYVRDGVWTRRCLWSHTLCLLRSCLPSIVCVHVYIHVPVCVCLKSVCEYVCGVSTHTYVDLYARGRCVHTSMVWCYRGCVHTHGVCVRLGVSLCAVCSLGRFTHVCGVCE